ncbi:MAG TPA: alpha/beta fold hydrolase [Propionibacteriaceae bacterium]|nr:alpha/beta fold hydrolase [Propionibacteriaceae bacterium]
MDSFSRAGLTFGVWDSIGPALGVPVVLLHGFPQQPSTFNDVVPLLNDRGLRTLVPTQRGYATAARPRRRRDYRTQETVADVVALLDAAGVQRAHIVGHDWGGFQAWGMGAWHPDRVASLTVLSTPHPAAFQRALVSSSQAVKSSYMGFFQLPLVPELLTARTLGKTLRDTRLSLKHLGRYCDAMAERGALTGALNWYRGLPFSLTPQVGPILVPTTYVWGRYDFALGRRAAELTERYVHAPYEFRELEAGHWLPEVEPDAVAQAVLDRIDSAT